MKCQNWLIETYQLCDFIKVRTQKSFITFSLIKLSGPLVAECDISVLKLLGFETFANFLRVLVSENLVAEKKSRFWKIRSRNKSLSFDFRKFALGKKSQFQFWRIWSRKKVLVSKNLL